MTRGDLLLLLCGLWLVSAHTADTSLWSAAVRHVAQREAMVGQRIGSGDDAIELLESLVSPSRRAVYHRIRTALRTHHTPAELMRFAESTHPLFIDHLRAEDESKDELTQLMEGGHGAVFAARLVKQPHQLVAVKLMLVNSSPVLKPHAPANHDWEKHVQSETQEKRDIYTHMYHNELAMYLRVYTSVPHNVRQALPIVRYIGALVAPKDNSWTVDQFRVIDTDELLKSLPPPGVIRGLLLEYCQGPAINGAHPHDLFEIQIAPWGQVSQAQRMQYVWEMTQGLALIHKAGVIHRDFHPGNVLLCETGENSYRAKITDFGYAGLAAGGHALSIKALLKEKAKDVLVIRGAPWYLPPEVVGLSTRSGLLDSFALGVSILDTLDAQLQEGNGFTGHSPQSEAVHTLGETWWARIDQFVDKFNEDTAAAAATDHDKRDDHSPLSPSTTTVHVRPREVDGTTAGAEGDGADAPLADAAHKGEHVHAKGAAKHVAAAIKMFIDIHHVNLGECAAARKSLKPQLPGQQHPDLLNLVTRLLACDSLSDADNTRRWTVAEAVTDMSRWIAILAPRAQNLLEAVLAAADEGHSPAANGGTTLPKPPLSPLAAAAATAPSGSTGRTAATAAKASSPGKSPKTGQSTIGPGASPNPGKATTSPVNSPKGEKSANAWSSPPAPKPSKNPVVRQHGIDTRDDDQVVRAL